MTAVPEGTHWCEFTSVEEKPSRNGGSFFLLRNYPFIPVCRIDASYRHLIEEELASLTEGRPTALACIKDANNPENWRISLKYYETRSAEQNGIDLTKLPTGQAPGQSGNEPSTKKVTFPLDTENHKVLQLMHNEYKLVHTDCPQFSTFVAKFVSNQLEPFRWLSEADKLPF